MKTRTRAYGYMRVSGKGQADGHGFDRQREAIERFARATGYEVVRLYQDTFTGTVDAADRPGFAAVIVDLNNGVNTIIVERLDRLARSVIAQEHTIAWLAAHDVHLVVADTGENVTQAYLSDPMKKALVQIQAVFAELEKSMIVKKLRAARRRVKAERGKCEGKKAYGEADSQEREAVKRIRQLRRKRKGLSRRGYRKIAQVLQEEGYPTRHGREWSPWTVRNIINGPVYRELGKSRKGSR